MDRLEKLVFLEATNKQFSKLPDNEYKQEYKLLTKDEQQKFVQISDEIHDLWNAINGNTSIVTGKPEVNDIEDCLEEGYKIDDILKSVLTDFDLTLKREISEEFMTAVIEAFGQEFFDEKFGNN